MSSDESDEIDAFEPEDPVISEALEWFVRCRDERPDNAAGAEFAHWFNADPAHRNAYGEVLALWSDLDAVHPAAPSAEAFYDASRRSARRWAGGAIAASLALLLAVKAPDIWIATVADAQTGSSETRDTVLADGTRVALDADSAIDVAIDASSRRITLLKGRAWFEVAHEARPFAVALKDAQVRDIGTAFEVAERSDGGEVTVTQGRVELSTTGGRALQLSKGEAARFDTQGRSRPVEAVPGTAPWRQGRLQFVDEQLQDVLGDLARYGTGRPVILDSALARRRMTGVVDLSDPSAARDAVLARVGAQARRIGPWLFVSPR